MITEEEWEEMNWTERITWILRALNIFVIGVFCYRFWRGEFRSPLMLAWFCSVLLALASPWILMALRDYKIERRKKKG